MAEKIFFLSDDNEKTFKTIVCANNFMHMNLSKLYEELAKAIYHEEYELAAALKEAIEKKEKDAGSSPA